MPDIALVVPLDGDRLRLVDQHRAAAVRELREETGLTTATLTRLGVLATMPSTWTQRCSVFLATNLTEGEPSTDTTEGDLRSAWFTRAEVETMIADGTLVDAKTVAAYALLQPHDA